MSPTPRRRRPGLTRDLDATLAALAAALAEGARPGGLGSTRKSWADAWEGE